MPKPRATYEEKRDAEVTNEPFGEGAHEGRFHAGTGTVGGTIAAADTAALGVTSLAVDTAANAATAVAALSTAVANLGTSQATVGALENKLQFAINLSQSQIVNTKAAESRIRDANIAEESANLTRYSILTQAGIAALAQANSQSGAVLSLLR